MNAIDPSQRQFLTALEQDWGAYVYRFRQLTPAGQAAFLSRQGYARLADLLAHVLAWWREAFLALEEMQRDPEYQPPEYDVDMFNALAIENASSLEEAEVVEAFEAMRAAFAKRLAELHDQAFQDARILARLEIEIIGHYAEHKLS